MCWKYNAGRLSAELAAEAKLLATELAGRVADACVQLHGGAGYMDEYRIGRLYTDARVMRIFAGTSEIMKEIIGRSLGLDERKLNERSADGVKIIEIAGLGAAPYGCMMLADMGAEVVRVDRSGGDNADTPARSPLLRNRRSMALDLKRPEAGVASRDGHDLQGRCARGGLSAGRRGTARHRARSSAWRVTPRLFTAA